MARLVKLGSGYIKQPIYFNFSGTSSRNIRFTDVPVGDYYIEVTLLGDEGFRKTNPNRTLPFYWWTLNLNDIDMKIR